MVSQFNATSLDRYFLKNLISLVLGLSLMTATLFPSPSKAGVPTDELQRKLGQIMNGNHQKLNVDDAESRHLALLNDFNKPEEKGRIYVALVGLGGYGMDREKVVKYAKEALKFPLDPLVGCEMLFVLGDYEGGLDLTNKYLKINQEIEVPTVFLCDSTSPDSNNDPCMKAYKASLKAHEEAMFQNALLKWHDRFIKFLARKH